jgi:hypothetical protein
MQVENPEYDCEVVRREVLVASQPVVDITSGAAVWLRCDTLGEPATGEVAAREFGHHKVAENVAGSIWIG